MPSSHQSTAPARQQASLGSRPSKKVEAESTIAELMDLSQRRYVAPYTIAVVYAGLGELEQSFRWLERAYEERSGWLIWLDAEPISDPLRSDPRFRDLLERMGLRPSESRADRPVRTHPAMPV